MTLNRIPIVEDNMATSSLDSPRSLGARSFGFRRPGVHVVVLLVLGGLGPASVAPLEAPGGDRWQALGRLDEAHVTALSVALADPGVLYAGTLGGGVFRSTDQGRTFSSVNRGLTDLFVEDMVVAPSAPQVLYVVAEPSLCCDAPVVFRSQDGGITWSEAEGRGLPRLATLGVDPLDPHLLYAGGFAGTTSALHTSVDGGESWSPVALDATFVHDLAFSPVAPAILFAATDDGVYRSEDRNTWVRVSQGPINKGPVVELVLDPTSAMTLYAGLGSFDGRVLKSVDGGVSWVEASAGLPRQGRWVLAHHPTASGTLYAGTEQGIFKTADGGARWAQVSTGITDTVIGALTVDPLAPEIVFAAGVDPATGSGSGVFRSPDGGASWVHAGPGLSASTLREVLVAPAPDGHLFVETPGLGPYRSENGGASFVAADGGLGRGRLHGLVLDRAVPVTLFARDRDEGNPPLRRSFDGGLSWEGIGEGLPGSRNSRRFGFAIDPGDPSVLWAATEGVLYRSRDRGASFAVVGRLPASASGELLALDSNSDLYVVEAEAGLPFCECESLTLHRSRDGGGTWTVVDALIVSQGAPTGVVRPHPLLATDLYLLAGGELRLSPDGGNTWSLLSRPRLDGVDRTITDFDLDPAHPGRLYVSTRSGGVFESRDRGARWSPLNEGLPHLVVESVAVDPMASGTLYAGLRGGGLYALRRAEPPCASGPTTLCLQDGRFRVEITWSDRRGGLGVGRTRPITDDSGAFWFFDGENLELAVKVLDGRAINDHFWVFYASLTHVAYTLVVTDTRTGRTRLYAEDSPEGFASRGDTLAFEDTGAPSREPPPPSSHEASPPIPRPLSRACDATSTSLCLQGDRFHVEVAWQDFQGATGSGQSFPLTADTGAFWFFHPANLELLVKVLDGRSVNGRFWVFYGALSNVGYTLTVTDTDTGVRKTYTNPLGSFGGRGDTDAF